MLLKRFEEEEEEEDEGWEGVEGEGLALWEEGEEEWDAARLSDIFFLSDLWDLEEEEDEEDLDWVELEEWKCEEGMEDRAMGRPGGCFHASLWCSDIWAEGRRAGRDERTGAMTEEVRRLRKRHRTACA